MIRHFRVEITNELLQCAFRDMQNYKIRNNCDYEGSLYVIFNKRYRKPEYYEKTYRYKHRDDPLWFNNVFK